MSLHDFCCRLKASNFPPVRIFGEIVCGHANICDIEYYQCGECDWRSTKPGMHHGKKMRLVKEKKIV